MEKENAFSLFFFPKKEFLTLRVLATGGELLWDDKVLRKQTGVRVWSRVLPVCPYLVLLHQ